ncbi:hypothetical protein PAPH110629_17360 [Paenibacillus phoenicis]
MRFTVQYIPLNKLRPGISVQLTQRIKSLRKAAQDCMHLMVVRKSRKHGGYIIVSGNHHYEFLRKHTKNTVAPCLVDQGKTSERVESLIHYFRKPNLPYEVCVFNGIGHPRAAGPSSVNFCDKSLGSSNYPVHSS